MWAALAPYLIKLGISLAITLLQKTGVISKIEADGIKVGTHVIQATRVEDSYPQEKSNFTPPN